MNYTIKDVLDKLIEIEINMSSIYEHISNLQFDEKYMNLKVLAKVMCNEERRHAAYFKQIKNDISADENIEIDFLTYDKISTLIYEFANKIHEFNKYSVKEFLKDIFNFEKENVALLIYIKGKIAKTSLSVNSTNYKILSQLIDEENEHVKNIGKYL
ncbi:hypothetical protein Ccar_07390 [Clostridium carboxidivorans P7]|uniref:Ferritin-like diiron domain-containing protein n=1 Tax=Clostridium carboxidivorans P7 TaxID=536227 RepID=C6PTR7_9CLOT|nr:hypothetical protein [Clostridium carboxidivorans]AKN30662.1 hypothetical protein Ccar_07390 [Clostridium carboxidivorans P7]EET87403.1 conserved hypothetical protein [Clostridium carboxidivorans P7]EFG86421.1 hypothetical protein CLCAR_4247 [Clostridium carboxidivorans P7]